MTFNALLQIGIFAAIIIALTPPLGFYLTRVLAGEPVLVSRVLRPIERLFYRLCGVREDEEQHWLDYGIAMFLFTLFGAGLVYLLERSQALLPFNPQHLPGVPPDLAMNTAISFVTNTNWQAYGGETTMSYLSQMAGLTVHNFLSAATGIAIAAALIRGFARRSAKTIGNFWVDLTRITLYILLPIAIIFALVMVWQGVPQNLHPYADATTLEGAHQLIAQGPVASQEAIKMLGTNGGGFFNANSAHPYENPTPLTNLIQMVLIFALAAGLTNHFGRAVGDQFQGWALFGAMGILFLGGALLVMQAEAGTNPLLAGLPIDQTVGDGQSGGNMEGKEVRFGIIDSALFATVTTDASCGAVNTMHDSLTPLGGLIPMLNMMLGEIIFGGVGSGLYGMLLFAIVAVFVAGLMVGRTPEYLGKKLDAREIKLTMLAILALPLSMLIFTAIAVGNANGLAGLANSGPHGFSEILYAYVSATANNGSAFAGLSANSLFYNVTLAIAMFVGRFFVIIPVLAIAGSLAAKKTVPPSLGTFPTQNGVFVALLISVILIVGGLTFFPVLALGPIVEHLAMLAGTVY